MATATRTKISYEEFLEWAGEDQHVEWVNGEVVSMSPVSNRHQDVAGFLLALLRFYAEARQLGEVRSEPYQMKPGPNLPGRAPDIFFVAETHLSRMKKTYLEGPADLVVEVISPESRVRDRGAKFYEYEQGGIPEYWLLDPVREQAEFYQLDPNGIYRLVPPDAQGRYHSAVLPGLWLQVDWLWETPLPPLLSVLKAWELV
ncbi:MAG: Uma2 family endonuclease [Armatimonadota bacterium]|nr:Uma2 family endonuclease [Armatimonadota bacterium]